MSHCSLTEAPHLKGSHLAIKEGGYTETDRKRDPTAAEVEPKSQTPLLKFIEDSHFFQNLHSEKYIPEKVYLIFVVFGDLMLFFSHIDFRLVLRPRSHFPLVLRPRISSMFCLRKSRKPFLKFVEDSHYLQNLHSEKYIPEKVYLIFVVFGDALVILHCF